MRKSLAALALGACLSGCTYDYPQYTPSNIQYQEPPVSTEKRTEECYAGKIIMKGNDPRFENFDMRNICLYPMKNSDNTVIFNERGNYQRGENFVLWAYLPTLRGERVFCVMQDPNDTSIPLTRGSNGELLEFKLFDVDPNDAIITYSFNVGKILDFTQKQGTYTLSLGLYEPQGKGKLISIQKVRLSD